MNVSRYFIIAALGCLCFSGTFAQQPLNLDFERKSVEGINRPWGWDIKSWGTTTFKMDSLTVKHGKFSLNSVNTKAGDQNVTSLSFIIEPFELKERKVSLTGSIKTADLNGKAGFSLGYSWFDSKADSFSEFDTAATTVSGTSGWKTYSVDLLIPATAQSVYVAINHSGVGKAWFDDLKLLLNGRLITQVKVAKPFSKENISWLNQHSFPVYSVKPGNNKNDDLLAFKNTAAGALLIALGESTHGTAEFFTLKNRLFQYAVTELGARVFAIEDNQLAAEKVNMYVCGGKGTAAESMSGMFAVWNTTEVLALVEWIRYYNDQHPGDKIHVAGFDMQEIGRPADSLFAFLKKRDTVLYKKSMAVLGDLKENASRSFALSDSVKLRWLDGAKEIMNDVNLAAKQWYLNSAGFDDSMYVMLGIQYANLVRQFAENTYKGHWSLYRDEAMAENVSWIMEKRYPKTKIFIWAHDVHISRCDHPDRIRNLNNSISMGSFLSKKYKGRYRSFSLSSYEGEYLALKSYTDFTKINAPLFKAPVGSLDEALHSVTKVKNTPVIYLPLPKTPAWLSLPIPKRFANHVNIDYGYWERISIPYQFDGMFFIDKTTAAEYLKK